MDFRTAARHIALSIDGDDMALGTMSPQLDFNPWQRGSAPPSTDGLDPAAGGGPAPYNGAEPFSEPVTSDPEWLDPSQHADQRGHTVPYQPGPTENITTLHNARRIQYVAREVRNR
jgi:hypothetical protein